MGSFTKSKFIMMDNKDVITIEEIFVKIINFVKLLKRNFFLILLFIIVGGAIGFIAAPLKKYNATTSLILKSSSDKGGFLNIASRFGLGSQNIISFDKIKAVSSSRKIYTELLMKSSTVDGKQDLLGHHLIDYYELEENWEEKPNRINVDLNKNSLVRDTIVNILCKMMDKNIFVSETKEKLVEIKTESTNHDLTYSLNNKLTDIVLKYFYDFEIANDINTKNTIEKKLDSVNVELISNEKLYAKLKDESYRMIKHEGMLELQRVERLLRILNQMQIELTTQNELVKFRILDKTSSFELLDQPTLPLEKKGMSKIIYLIIGMIFGSFLGVFFFVSYDFYRGLKNRIKNQIT